MTLDDHRPPIDDDDIDVSQPTPQEVEAAEKARDARSSGKVRRSGADDFLDLLDGRSRKDRARDLSKCPKCRSSTRLMGNSVTGGTFFRRCRNGACRNEYPVSSQPNRTEVPPVPPIPILHGGPFAVGPNRGGQGAPPMDHEQPVSRRISEIIRRMSDVE